MPVTLHDGAYFCCLTQTERNLLPRVLGNLHGIIPLLRTV